MRIPKLAAVDFETKGIESRPEYPPLPVGVAIQIKGKRPEYLAWGHPIENNCTKAQAIKRLKQVYKEYEIVFHNAKFDLEVGAEHCGKKSNTIRNHGLYIGLKHLGVWPEKRIHDTMILAFLHNPHSKSLSLKPLANLLLNMSPEEQDQVKEWIITHIFTSEKSGQGRIQIADKKPSGYFKIPPSKFGAFIAYAPGKLVGKYAKGDVVRTLKLFMFFWEYINRPEVNMIEPYEREIKLIPILIEMEKKGVSVNKKRLKEDINICEERMDRIDSKIRKIIKAPKSLSVDKGEEFADALEKAGKVDGFIFTAPSRTHPNGQRSTSQDNLKAVINDSYLLEILKVRSKLATNVRTFMRGWLITAEESDGKIYTSWNSVRSHNERIKGGQGTRTGRFSSSPNFQNIPKEVEIPDGSSKKVIDLYSMLPIMRNYVIPDKGKILIRRDYSQQELRVLGHFEDGPLLEAYNDDPLMDVHDLAKNMINALLHSNYPRKPIKNTGFGILYGMGIEALMNLLGCDEETARTLRKAYLAIFPGLDDLIKDLKRRARKYLPLRTWGGRQYFVEEPAIINGRMRTFEYKLLNYLIQGSSADITKEAIINSSEAGLDVRLTVHDELIANADKKTYKDEMHTLMECMESVPLDVQLLSDGEYSSKSWGEMKPFKDRR